VDFEAFVEFSDLGLDDYIIDLDWDIEAKRFLPSHHTAGDLRAINVGQKQSKKQKVFKTLGPLKRENSEPVNIHDSGYNLDAPAVEGNQTQSDSERNVILNTAEKITEILGDKIVNEVINHNSFSENVNVKIEESVTNISDVLNQKIEQSNSFTTEQITELESNMNMINNTHIHSRELKTIEERVTEQNEKIKQEIDRKIEKQKDFFTKFLNS
jgi:hypothetical protein